MTLTSENDIAAKLAALQNIFHEQLPAKMIEIGNLWDSLLKNDGGGAELADLHRNVHNLAGSGGTFGAVVVGTAARELEQVLKTLISETDDGSVPSRTMQDQIEWMLKRLRQSIDEFEPTNIPYIQPAEQKEQRISDLVYLAEDDEMLAADIIAKLEQANYEVRHFLNLEDFEAACEDEIPVAVIMDIIFDDGDVTGADVIKRMKERKEACPPVIFISVHDEIETRLAAAAAGARRYFTKPLDTQKLIESLDGLTSRSATKPFRILLIDDDEVLLEYYSTILLNVGMDVRTLQKPLEGLKVLRRFKPDVVVMDVYMPDCTGPELAQVIRQDDTWAMMPIMFLSTESDLTIQLESMNLGGDDFLVKPVEPHHLVGAVSARAKRARWTHRLNADLQIAMRESKFQLATMDQHAIVSMTDTDGVITDVNDKFCEVSGYTRDEMIGKTHNVLKSDVHPKEYFEKLWKTISSGKVWNGIICNRRKDGSLYWVESTIVPFLDNKGKPYKYVSARTDITDLRQNAERLQRSQTFANIGNWDWDITNGELFWSDNIWPLFGYEKAQEKKNDDIFVESLHPEDRERVEKAIEDCVENGESYDIEYRVIWPDGSDHWLHDIGNIAYNDDGKPIHMLGVVQNIDTRKIAELELIDRESQLQEAQRLAHFGSWELDMVTGELTWSEELFRLFGIEPFSFTPTMELSRSIVYPDDTRLLDESEKLLKTTGHMDVAYRVILPDGQVRHTHLLAKTQLDSAGNPVKLVGTVQDITERVEAEDRFTFAVEGAGDGIWSLDMTTGAMEVSPLFAKMLGYGEGELTNSIETWMNITHPDDIDRARNLMRSYLSGKVDKYSIELRMRCKDGSYKWVQTRGTAMNRTKGGRALRMAGVQSDISERIERELRLGEVESRNRSLLNSVGEGIYGLDMQGKTTFANPAAAKMLGYTAEELIGQPMHPLVHHSYADGSEYKREDCYMYASFRDGQVHRVDNEVLWRKDGTSFPVEYVSTPALSEGEIIGAVVSFRDISLRLAMEQQLDRQRELLDMLHHSTTDYVVKGNLRETMQSMLSTLLKITDSEYGFTGEIFIDEEGAPYLKTHAITNIAWNEETQALYNENLESGFEFRNLDTLFGKVMTTGAPVISNDPTSDPRAGGRPEGHPPLKAFLGVPVYYGAEMVGMYGIANRDGGYDEEIQNFLNPFDSTYGAMIHSQRMTDREETNLAALVEAKDEAESANRAKSQFLSSMSHELRTPMNAIMGFGQLLKMEDDPPLSESQEENVEEIVKAGKHLLGLINEVLDLARIESGRIDLSIEAVIVSEVISECLQLIAPLASNRNIEIILIQNGVQLTEDTMSSSMDAVRADRVRLKQALLNLLSNAVKYNRVNGKITINCDCEPGALTHLSVTDTGEGLDEAGLAQLFKSFNRLGKENSEIEGSGIGLVITKSLVELMGGKIDVVSVKGEGSTFTIELPSDVAPVLENITEEDDVEKLENQDASASKHTVLYIEDNPANLRLVAQLLGRRPNIHLWSAHEPLLGLELAAEHQPDLILLDINLPGMDGFEVLKQLRLRDGTSDTPVFAISANAMPKDIDKGMAAGFDKYITKPIDVKTLLEAVEGYLNEIEGEKN